MQATEREIQVAYAIKRAAIADPFICDQDVSDFEYLQHAILAVANEGKEATQGGSESGGVAKALKRIARMAKFKQINGILADGSLEQGLRDVKILSQTHPGFFQGIATASSTKHNRHFNNDRHFQQQHYSVLCYDFSKFKALPKSKSSNPVSKSKRKEFYAIVMRGYFYHVQACLLDFDTLRAGYAFIGDCTHTKWDNLWFEAEKRASQLYSEAYPMRIREFVMTGAPWFVRLLYTLIRPFVSQKTRDIMNFPAHLSTHLTDREYDLSSVPQAWGGSLSLPEAERTMEERLAERYKNATNFVLPEDKETYLYKQ
jgi:hypothetical protein